MERIKLIKQVFQELEKNNISYCVLRNYDFLLENRAPCTASERSLDLCVSQEHFLRFDKQMRELGFQTRKPQFSKKHIAYFIIHHLEPISFDVQVGGVHWNDMVYLPELDILAHRIKQGFFYVPSDNDTVTMLIFHSILGKRRFKPEYKKKIFQLWNKVNKEYVSQKLQDVLSTESAREIMNLIDKNNFDEIISKGYKYIFLFIVPLNRIRIFVPLLFRWIKWKKFFTAAPLISIIGTDGAGKSTLVVSLEEYLKVQHRKVAVVYTGRGKKQLLPRVIREAGYYYKQKERRRDLVATPHLFWRRGLYIFYSPIFMIDLGLRYIFLVFPKRRTKHIVITDRYCTDIWLMRHLPLFIKKFYLSLFPMPTLTFYLYNTPEVLQQRRPQEKKEEFEYQLSMFKELKEHLPMISLQTSDVARDKEIVLSTVMAYLYQEWW